MLQTINGRPPSRRIFFPGIRFDPPRAVTSARILTSSRLQPAPVCLVYLVCFVDLVHLVSLVYLVCFVYFVGLVQPNEQDRLADIFSILLEFFFKDGD
jgi:hypothetical protein